MCHGLKPIYRVSAIVFVSLAFLVVAPVVASEIAPASMETVPDQNHGLPGPAQNSEPTPTPSPEINMQPGGTVTLTGRLNVLHGDPPAVENGLPQLVMLLTEGNGTVHELAMDPSTALNLDRQLVQVVGQVADSDEFSVQQIDATFIVIEVLSITPLSGVEASEQAVSGSKPWINILCRFSDVTSTPHGLSWYKGLFGTTYPGLDHFWRQASYNKLNIAGTKTLGWYRLPRARSFYIDDSQYPYGANLTALANHCTKTADPYVYFPDYAGINLMFNDDLDCCAWGGSMYMNLDGRSRMYSMTWLPPWAHEHSVIAHEMGHGFGLPHSSGPADNPPSELNIYVSQWDVMSDSQGTCDVYDTQYGCLGPGTIAYHLDISGWLPATRKQVVGFGEEATITLEQLQLPRSSTNYLMAKIPIKGSSTHFYTVEVRTLAGYDQNVPGKAVIIHDVDTTRTGNTGPALVVDADDGNDNVNDAGAKWTVGETYRDTANNIEIKVLSAGTSSFKVKISNSSVPSCEQVTQIPSYECNALKLLYERTNGSNWTTRSGWIRTTSPCGWYGVTCSGGHVTALNLNNNNLTGTIPYQLGSLSMLQTLNLKVNKLSGGIPSQLGDLNNLRVLWLNNNRLTGNVPSELGSLPNLQQLSLQTNLLMGNLPGNLANLGDTLVSANFGYNRFTASHPNVITFLQNKDPDWAQTQTVPPTNVRPTYLASTRVRVSWIPIPYAGDGGFYRVYYATSSNGPYQTGCFTENKTARYCWVTGLSPNTQYYFKVRTYTQAHGGQVELWSLYSAAASAQTLLPDTPAPAAVEVLTTPKLLSPATGTTTTNAVPEFTWSSVAGAVSYRIEMNDTSDFASIPYTAAVTGVETYTPAEPITDGLYYWRIVALGASGNESNPSAAWRIRVNAVPTGAPNLIAPSSDMLISSSKPVFEWEAPADTDRYKLQVSNLPDFSNFVLIVNQAETTYSSAEALGDGDYYWRVSARGIDGVWSDWSTIWTFTIDTTPEEPATPTPTSPPTPVDLPFYDSFDSAAGWTANGTWRLEMQSSRSGASWFADSTLREQISMLSYDRPITLSSSQPVALNFWRKTLLTNADRLGVDLSLDGGLSWLQIYEETGGVSDWALSTVDLTPYLGQIVVLRFRLDTMAVMPDSTSTLGLWIDDVAIDAPQPPPPTNTPDVLITETPTGAPTDIIEPTSAPPDVTPTNTPLPTGLPFVETFDSGQNWLPVGAWQIDPQNAHSGASWFANSTLRNQINTLTYSGQIDMRMALNPQLSFWQKTDLSSSDLFAIEISLDGGELWQTLDQQIGQGQDWTWRLFDLTAYRGQVISLRFRLDTMNAPPANKLTVGVWIDDLLIQDILATPTPTDTPVNEVTPVPTETPLPSHTPAETPTSTPLPRDTPTETPTGIPTAVPTETQTSTPTITPLPTDTPTETPTERPLPTDTPTDVPIPIEETAES